jgi:hypothetical protein
MTSSIPPNPWFSTINFNESFFKSNTQSITLAYADATYLKRIGIATSVASLTTFSGDVEVNGISTFNDDAVFNGTGANNITIDGENITQINSNNPLNISSNYGIQIDTIGEILIGSSTGGNGTAITIDDSSSILNINNTTGTTIIGDTALSSNGTIISIDDPAGEININANAGSISLVSENVINLNADLNGEINIFSGGAIRIGNITGAGAELAINPTKTTLKTVNGFQLTNNSIQFPSTFYNSNQTLSSTYPYALTFNGTSLTATLPVVSSTNAGTQFLITNTNAGSMTINTSSSQLMYFSGSSAVSTRTISTGGSHLFTAIRTTSSTTFGWSIV